MSRRNEIVLYLKDLRERIIREFEVLENSNHRFIRTAWPYQKGEGGGEISLLRGEKFEKAAVNWSGVSGPNFPGSQTPLDFFATGVSLITHMANPKAPTVHFNIRYIETAEKFWFGGGFDLTPMGFEFADDTAHFHKVARQALEGHGTNMYETFSQNAREYFYIPHRQRERGVGGLFFDHYQTENFDADLAMWKSVGEHFLPAILPIYQRRLKEQFEPVDRQEQLKRRAHYVEFNLLYDRGTKFGFQSGGNPEAILCSMPPLAAW